MSKPMTKQEWLSYLEQAWDAAQKEAWGEQPRQWVGLTEEERMDVLLALNWDKRLTHMDTARAIEAKLKEKNT